MEDYIDDLRREWESFLETMRSQTGIELALNGWWFRRNESGDLESTPDMQWIVLHPIVLLVYVDEAKDGDQMDEAIGLEIFGANWWKQDKWYVPSGGSVLALYSDREDVADWGYGLAIHFKNSYTLGYTKHGSDDGVFLSIDLLKAFQDKEKAFNSYFENRYEIP